MKIAIHTTAISGLAAHYTYENTVHQRPQSIYHEAIYLFAERPVVSSTSRCPSVYCTERVDEHDMASPMNNTTSDSAQLRALREENSISMNE